VLEALKTKKHSIFPFNSFDDPPKEG